MAVDFSFKWIGGATWILEGGGLKIACDPVLSPSGTVQDYFWFKSKRREEPEYETGDFKDVDLWLITHGHEDHLDEAGLDFIDKKSVVITHKNGLPKLKKTKLDEITTLSWGEVVRLTSKGFKITVEAMPAVHGVNPLVALLAGGVNGYWVTLEKPDDKISIYIPSDTVIKKKVIDSLEGRKCDLFIPNLGAARIGAGIRGRLLMDLTLTAEKIGKIIEVINPKITIPVHFGTFSHYTEPVDKIRALAEEAGDKVKMLKPGQEIKFTLWSRQ
ncbi:MAG: MBL fold metallo-hydrolase [Deltaproteobacteria bacterium]|uniref:MBL fold metallo-hydrolase n=1 Tax=Candidatus Zymogenus saltonus TaxID=2844893 RepID=A0A9D8PIZ2_9DELT|nr:MBL fold metallo-hydrolase [Candidatus Zymogenus saltonus]